MDTLWPYKEVVNTLHILSGYISGRPYSMLCLWQGFMLLTAVPMCSQQCAMEALASFLMGKPNKH